MYDRVTQEIVQIRSGVESAYSLCGGTVQYRVITFWPPLGFLAVSYTFFWPGAGVTQMCNLASIGQFSYGTPDPGRKNVQNRRIKKGARRNMCSIGVLQTAYRRFLAPTFILQICLGSRYILVDGVLISCGAMRNPSHRIIREIGGMIFPNNRVGIVVPWFCAGPHHLN